MFLFKSHKRLSHKQTALIGFVLAIMSILASVLVAYGFPLLLALMHKAGVFHLDIFLTALGIVLFLSVQGLLLFGFPLFYARDKKSHMTGFQILLYALFWMVVITAIIVLLSLALI